MVQLSVVQNVLIFRARVPWNEELGIPKGLSQVKVEREDKTVFMMYNLKDDVVGAHLLRTK